MQNLKASISETMTVYDSSVLPRSVEVPGEVSISSGGFQPQGQNDYWVYLRHRAPSFTLKKAKMTDANGNWGAFFPMPWVKQNCFADCETCFKNGNYQQILVAHCGDRPFRLELHFQNDNDPNKWGKTTHEIRPDCSIPGQVECVG